MKILVIANIVAVLVAAWAAWEFHLTTHRSGWDSPKTAALVFFALGALLDSPWQALSESSFSMTGRYYFFTVVGHICYLVAAASGVKYIYLRLLPDEVVIRLARTRMTPLLIVAIITMVVCFVASPRTSSLTAEHLYLVRADGWLLLYWMTFYVALVSLLLLAIYGVNRLRTDPRSVMLNLLMVSLGLGALSCIVSGLGIATGHTETTRLVGWPIAYAAIAVGSVAVVLAWRHRVWAMLRPRRTDGEDEEYRSH